MVAFLKRCLGKNKRCAKLKKEKVAMKTYRIFKILILIFLVIILFGGGIWMIYIRAFKSINFEQVCIKDGNLERFKEHAWFTLRSPEYHGFYSEELLDTLKVDYDDIIFDYDHYTYIVTLGHELLNIEYSRSDMKNRIYGIFGKEYVGHVTLKEEFTNKIYIYRIKKLDIDCDYHEPKRAVTYSS